MSDHEGKLVHNIKLEVKDCEKVVIDGVTHRDVMPLLFEDGGYRSAYSITDRSQMGSEQERIVAEQERKKFREEQRESVRRRRAKEKADAKLKMEERIAKDKETKARVEQALKNGVRRKDLVCVLGITMHNVKKAISTLREEGMVIKRESPYAEEDDVIMLKMRKEGADYKEIGKVIGKSASSVGCRYRLLVKKGEA